MFYLTKKGHLWKRRRQYFGTGEGDIVRRRSCTWDRRSCTLVRRVWSDGTREDDNMEQEKLYMGQESSIGWDRRKWLDGTGEVVYGSGEFDRMGQDKTIWWDRNKTIFWQHMSHFYSCKDDCYQNCKVIVTKNLRWNYHLTMDEKWPNYQGMAARYWMSHQYHLAFYFWCTKTVLNALSVTATKNETHPVS